MGKKSPKTTTTSGPPKWAQPIIEGAAGQISDTVGANQGYLDQMAGDLRGFLPGLGQQAFGQNAGLNAATGYAQDVLGGKYLGQNNPYLNDMASLARSNTGNDINTMFSKAGRVGGDSHYADLARGMDQAELGLRYQDYGNERNQMTQAAGMMPSLNQSQYAGVMPYLAAQQTAAGLPYTGIGQLGSIGGLLGGYGTQTQSGGGGGMGSAIAGGLASALPFILSSDRRLKTKIKLLRRDPDGLGWYEYAYKNDPSIMLTGVMADEVKELRPHAYVPNFKGEYAGVNYAKLSEAA